MTFAETNNLLEILASKFQDIDGECIVLSRDELNRVAERLDKCENFQVENTRSVLDALRLNGDRHDTTQKQIDALTLLINCQRELMSRVETLEN